MADNANAGSHARVLAAVCRELDHAAEVNARAAARILECAEAVLAAEAPNGCAFVEARIMEIMEACSFQDISGQHIAKASAALADLKDLLERGARDGGPDRRTRRRKLMLNGPAAPGRGATQAEIDAIFDS